MSINGVAWESGLSSQQEYSTSSRRDGRDSTQAGQPEASAMAKNNGQSWIERMGKEVKAALLAASYALTSTKM
jgi:hypothetical protein